MKKKKKFVFDYPSRILLASILFAVSYETLKGSAGKGWLSPDRLIGLGLLAGSLLLVFFSMRKLVLDRRAQLIAEYEAREKAAAEAAEADADTDADEGQDDSDDTDDQTE